MKVYSVFKKTAGQHLNLKNSPPTGHYGQP